MTPFLVVVLSACVLVCAQVVLVAGAALVLRRTSIYKIVIGIVLLTAPLVFVSDRLVAGQPLTLEGRLFLVLFHLGLGGLFFHFMTLPDRSVTLRMLTELDSAPGGTLSVDEMNARYGVRDMITSRLAQLQDGRFLTIDAEGRLTLLPRGAGVGRFVSSGRQLFQIGSAN